MRRVEEVLLVYRVIIDAVEVRLNSYRCQKLNMRSFIALQSYNWECLVENVVGKNHILP